MAGNNSKNGGCGCLILIVLVLAVVINKCNDSNSSSGNSQSENSREVASQQSYTTESLQEEELTDEDKLYMNNSLPTGATPYSQIYGKNYTCPYNQCSGIRVTAPHGSDIVVIIKRNNQNGKVIAHGFIKSGATCQFDLPDGTYQTFFYYGEGWNPNKIMKGGVKGGFVKNEIFSKDNPQDIYSGILSYVLQLQRDGNFQTKGSNRSEVF